MALPVARFNEPVSTFAVPELNTTAPLTAVAVAPVIADNHPVEPALVRPEATTRDPLTPALTAFALRIVTDPDDDDAPLPLTTLTTPPVIEESVVAPAVRYM